MRYLLLGAGQVGRAIAYDLLRDPDAEVVLADKDPDQLEDVVAWLDDPRVDVEPIDAAVRDECQAAMDDIDVAISALPPGFNLELTQDALETGTHFVSVGGDPAEMQAQLELDGAARELKVTVVPDCGLAPGLAILLASDACHRLTRVESLKIRVGGLPQKPQGELDYMLTVSMDRLLRDYSDPALVVRNGELVSLEPLTEIERINFPEPYGELEAFLTANALSTLPHTVGHKVENMDLKTIRYPGHGAKMRALFEQGLLSREPRKLADGTEVIPADFVAEMIERTCNYPEADVVLLRVTAQGTKNNVPLMVRTQIIDRFDKENGITAMMRMSGYPASITAQLISHGEITERGVVPVERAIPIDPFRSELKHRDMQLEEVVKVLD
jgi:lysine 6-dehydrogenase